MTYSFIKAAMIVAVGLTATSVSEQVSAKPADKRQFEAMKYRNIGPFRGGRATAIAGVPGDPTTYYMGATGGVWRTTDAGTNWAPIADKFLKTASVGAIAVAPSDPNVIVVGMGESPFRGVASSHGDGVYISTDGGTTFKNMGLSETRQISAVHIDPNDPNIIYVAAQGSSWAPNKERGVFKTTDGGKTWKNTLFVSDVSGAVDLSLDPNNPRILYAAMWDHEREPWEIRSGGEGSGIWKSLDGGDTWKKMGKGLPKEMGKIGVVAAPAKSGRVWAIVEAKKKGGVYRSDDYGETWTHTSGNRNLHARSWYYMHIFADPKNADIVYVQNSAFYKSVDGGKKFSTRISGTHGDFHDFWINPDNPDTVAVANDGGAAISFNGGKTWTTQHNQMTGQFYRVNVDNDFFYRVYAGQQDNSTVAIRGIGPDGGIGLEDYSAVGGGESAHVSFDPNNPRYVYAGSYLGTITEYDRETKSSRNISAYPEVRFGVAPKERKYRFNWNAPVLVSAHDTKVIYHAGNVLFRSSNRGNNWDVISPDLTKADPKTLDIGGRPITNEVSENYATIFALSESPRDPNILWTGSDDGLVNITTDGGANWKDVTPKKTGKGLVNSIELSPHTAGTAYVVFTRYKYNDHTPLIYKTTNNGKSWKNIAKGLPEDAFVRVVREDPTRKGLLYAGTELGMFVSFNDGGDWQPLKLNMPVVPITDIKVHEDDIVLSTQGRAFWVLDDIAPIRNASVKLADKAVLYKPSDAYDLQLSGRANSRQAPNPTRGAVIYYTLPDGFDHKETVIKMEILDANDKVLRTMKSSKKKEGKGGGRGAKYKLPAKEGLNKAVWNLSEEPRKGVKGVWSIAWGSRGSYGGPNVLPGDYKVRLTVGEETSEQTVTVKYDPRHSVTDAQWAEKRGMIADMDAIFTELNKSVIAFRSARLHLKGRLKGIKDKDLKKQGKDIIKAMKAWEDAAFASDRAFFQDVLNWPDKLVADLSFLMGAIDGQIPPMTQGSKDRYTDLKVKWDEAIASRDKLLGEDIAAFNTAYREKGPDVLDVSGINEADDTADESSEADTSH